METYALPLKYKDLDNKLINAMLYEYYYRAILFLFLIVSPLRNIMENVSTLSSA